jgi:hypothetical protein
MTRDDIIRMARKSGFAHGICWAAHEKDLLMFANLVAAAEREECAKVCVEYYNNAQMPWQFRIGANECAYTIRERGAP